MEHPGRPQGAGGRAAAPCPGRRTPGPPPRAVRWVPAGQPPQDRCPAADRAASGNTQRSPRPPGSGGGRQADLAALLAGPAPPAVALGRAPGHGAGRPAAPLRAPAGPRRGRTARWPGRWPGWAPVATSVSAVLLRSQDCPSPATFTSIVRGAEPTGRPAAGPCAGPGRAPSPPAAGHTAPPRRSPGRTPPAAGPSPPPPRAQRPARQRRGQPAPSPVQLPGAGRRHGSAARRRQGNLPRDALPPDGPLRQARRARAESTRAMAASTSASRARSFSITSGLARATKSGLASLRL